MITDVILLFFGLIFAMLGSLLSLISYTLPSQITTAITYFLAYFSYLQGFFPVSDFFIAIGFLISFWTLWYGYKVILFGYAMLPMIGKGRQSHPKLHS